jgi:hypothetical protein
LRVAVERLDAAGEEKENGPVGTWPDLLSR